MAAFKPAQEQRWNLSAGFIAAMGSPSARRELRGWCGLALISLAIAGIYALMVALSRVPLVYEALPWVERFFHKWLVIHVILSFVVWFLAVLGALFSVAAHRLTNGTPGGGLLSKVSIWFGYAAMLLLLIPGVLDRGEPTLSNYVPVIEDPIYYTGLAVLALSLGLALIRLLLCLPRRTGPLEPVSLSALNGGALFTIALICFAIAGSHLIGEPVDTAFNENLFWGGGHLLQFVNVGLMIVVWYILGGLALGQPLIRPNMLNLGQGALLAAAAAAPVFYALFDAFSEVQTLAFTNLQYAFAVPTTLVAAFGLSTIITNRSRAVAPDQHTASLTLLLSIAVFAVGGFLGLFVDGADARTPAHYHGVIGGVNLAFMGLFYGFFLPLLGQPASTSKATNLSLWFYALGQTLHALGLFIAGGYGASRKTAGAEQGIDGVVGKVALYGMGIGAVIAVIGGIMFVWIAGRRLLAK